MTRQLPSKPSLEQLRKQAKDIHKAHKKADPSCCAVLRNLKSLAGKPDADILKAEVSLRDVQFALAMEYGFKSWDAMKAQITGQLLTAKGQRVLEDVIADALPDDADRLLISSLLSETSPQAIARRLNALTEQAIGEHIVACHLLEIGVGMAFGLTMESGQRILLKVHGPDVPIARLLSVHEVLTNLRDSGFPCPRPLCLPIDIGNARATFQAFIDEGTPEDAHTPRIRRLMAEALARHIAISKRHVSSANLARWGHRPSGSLWPKPHNALFNFENTTEGAEHIDEIARKVIDKAESNDSPVVVGHADWATKHFRFADNRITVIYDWDALRIGTEAQILGNAAVSFTYRQLEDEGVKYTDPDLCVAFVREYEAARERKFTKSELESIAAAGTYCMAYRARCEHAVNTKFVGSCRQALGIMTTPYYFAP